eukprot:TRINITY_DN15403_c0_g1_i2.p1 TRINITY_DN15403_c0_g1~~TRINITY_DN15403_c0_g1_i2.p1  ORF type:complete len:209 (+),score=56.72 TRINITY_DN15403_c0_g1_i2:37-627(+)
MIAVRESELSVRVFGNTCTITDCPLAKQLYVLGCMATVGIDVPECSKTQRGCKEFARTATESQFKQMYNAIDHIPDQFIEVPQIIEQGNRVNNTFLELTQDTSAVALTEGVLALLQNKRSVKVMLYTPQWKKNNWDVAYSCNGRCVCLEEEEEKRQKREREERQQRELEERQRLEREARQRREESQVGYSSPTHRN